MVGETDLQKLLLTMQPMLLADEFVFCSAAGAKYGDFAELNPLAVIAEDEGLSLVLRKSHAVNAGLKFHGVFRKITLRVHSSLEAVGFTAAIASKLSENGISANVIAAYHHDHIMVPADQADFALQLLTEFAE